MSLVDSASGEEGQMNNAPPSPQQPELSRAEETILMEGTDDVTLVDVLNAYTASTPEATDWNRKFRYISDLQLGASRLLAANMITLRCYVEAERRYQTLDQNEAQKVLADYASWWRYDFDEEEGYGLSATDVPEPLEQFVLYWIDTTSTGLEVINSR
jgi:hypothetical protein